MTSRHTRRVHAISLALTPVAWASLAVTPAWNFSQMRGTPKITVGCTSRRFSGTFSIDSAKYTVAPLVAGMWIDTICSAMCDSGRYDRPESPSRAPPTSMSACAVHARFACESITPLGGPVVPDV